MSKERDRLKDKQRIVVKVGSSTITHEETGHIDFIKLEKLVRILTDLHNRGKEVVLVTSGAVAVGRKAMGLSERPKTTSQKQACAAVGQASLMTVYQKLFSEYHQPCAQLLLTKITVLNEITRQNACNTFEELFRMGVIPIVNENDTVATDELEDLEIGDNDTLSALVTAMIHGDLLILLSDIDGMYSDDPKKNPEAVLFHTIETLDETILGMAKGSSGSVGTGGMQTKLAAARIATEAGADMVIANGDSVEHILGIMNGELLGTLFTANPVKEFRLLDYIRHQ
ncbi:MAG: glutamate 5-kinase [Lachnospiraceae bacterium]|nr:glutamate 5-kinase [Lachnospiraceae bacterium]